MKKNIIIQTLALCFACSVYGQTEQRRGLPSGGPEAGGGKERLAIENVDIPKTVDLNMADKAAKNLEYRDNVILGGQDLRIRQPNKNFLEVSAFFGINPYNYKFFNSGVDMNYGLISNNYFLSTYYLFSLSLNMTYNYKICNGLYFGLGVEPTLYKGAAFYKFDVPATAKLSYELRGAELSIMYKHGFRELMKVGGRPVKIRDVQTKVVLPF